MSDKNDLKEATEKYKNSESNSREIREEYVALLRYLVENDIFNLTELAIETGIRRTTLYYMIWGKSGKRHQDA